MNRATENTLVPVGHSNIRVILFMLIALGMGCGLGYYFSKTSTSENLFVAPSKQRIETPKPISIAKAEAQRQEHYEAINSIRDILKLPSLFARNEALHILAGRSDKTMLIALIKQTQGINNQKQRRTTTHTLAMRLTELDPYAASEFARQRYQNGDRSLLAVVYENWATLAMQAAIDEALSYEKKYLKNIAAQGILAAISIENTKKRAEISALFELNISEAEHIGQSLAEQSTYDPKGALKKALAMAKSPQRDGAISNVFYTWAQKAPEAAFKALEQINNRRLRQQLLETIWYQWAEKDPETAYETMQNLPSDLSSANLSYAVFAAMARNDARATLEKIDTLSSARERSDAYNATISAWAESDPQSAANYVIQIQNKQLQQQLAPLISSYFAKQAPEQALQWAADIDPNGKLYIINSVISEIASKDANKAMQVAQRFEKKELRQQLIASVLDSFAYNDPEQATRMIDELPDSDVNSQIINSAVYSWAYTDPEAAISWINTKNKALREEALTTIGSQIATIDPDLATSYLPQLSGDVRNNWIRNITHHYSSYDLSQAEIWIEDFRNEAIFNELLSSVASTAANNDVTYALELAEGMPSQQEKNQLKRQIADQISYSDPERAKAIYAELPEQ